MKGKNKLWAKLLPYVLTIGLSTPVSGKVSKSFECWKTSTTAYFCDVNRDYCMDMVIPVSFSKGIVLKWASGSVARTIEGKGPAYTMEGHLYKKEGEVYLEGGKVTPRSLEMSQGIRREAPERRRRSLWKEWVMPYTYRGKGAGLLNTLNFLISLSTLPVHATGYAIFRVSESLVQKTSKLLTSKRKKKREVPILSYEIVIEDLNGDGLEDIVIPERKMILLQKKPGIYVNIH